MDDTYELRPFIIAGFGGIIVSGAQNDKDGNGDRIGPDPDFLIVHGGAGFDARLSEHFILGIEGDPDYNFRDSEVWSFGRITLKFILFE